jgi:hypothetical protein
MTNQLSEMIPAAYYAHEMKTACVLFVAVPLLIGVLIQDNSCSNKRNSQATAANSPAPSASVVMKKGSPTPPPKTASSPNQLSPGIWGGNHANLEISEGKSSLEFDCANGTISEPIVLDSNGHFEVQGFYVREGPGPVREGGNGQSRAIYSGDVKDDTMTLSIRLDGSSDVVLNVTITRGKQGRLRKCY